MSNVVKTEFRKELNDILVEYLDSWACSWNWKLYKKEYFPINALNYYKPSKYLFEKEMSPENSNKKRNDFIYWELAEIGGYISHLQEVFAVYSIHDTWNKERFIKKIVSDNDRKKSFKKFLKQIVEEPSSYDRSISIQERIDQSNTDEKIFYLSKIYKDFCRIHEYLNSQFNSSAFIRPMYRLNTFSGTLTQAVLYHFTLINSGIEKDIDRNALQKECQKLASLYGFTGYKRFSDHFSAIANNREIVRGGAPFTYDDAKIVEKGLRQKYPNRPDIIEHLYNKTRPIYP